MAADAASAGPHVLLVEDSALARDAVCLLLTETGHRVSIATTVAETIAACDADPPDVMLLDLTLPDGDGLSVLPPLRSRDHLPRAVVALTGHDDPETRARCVEAGCAAVLVKPVPIRELLRVVGSFSA